jgi:hypothetical protein
MKKIILPVLGLLVAAFSTQTLQAQKDFTVGVHYNYSLPSGSFKSDYISKGSARGGFIDIMYHLNSKLALGLNVGYQDFYEKYPRAVYKTGEGSDISAVMTNSVQTTPFLPKISYRFIDKGFIQPYVEGAAGLNFTSVKQYLGEFTNTSTASVRFAAQAGAGIFIPLKAGNTTGIRVGGAYNYMPYSSSGSISNLSNINIYAGVSFPLR